ncbi:hypothetical protein KPL47_00750 [Clostridium estertheticum]|uniref:hypothetical protein n=1 Tax=Clostridium estertheticum TaxID=238834 RepID=UPI001C0AA9F3|nr:hypothetical protein [Clostridium estertheticum]MBU3174890.1 hypothetical protein [Clostridium estertheticum]
MNKDGIRFCEKCGINMDFKTSIYNNELNKNEEEIKKNFEEELLGKYKVHVEKKHYYKVIVDFGIKDIIKITSTSAKFEILYYDVFVNYSQGANKEVESIEVKRNHLKFLNEI